ncbi:hypothetical protein GE253_24150 [Niveispirillum sp. SYP-B3756]|uniref:hypothetical protein n=1 Tax=Niveispirillum sp. SYP-B3756 TaxID=2662178 RepID=UPI0012922F2C|nr:hypothetical protein [Niveispirillum sp. SYP-B3756]MQP68416.1 hypothetical protein [Niveispirillum sp. SYP-B3756]
MKPPQSDEVSASADSFAEEVIKVRAELTNARSATLLQLFNFLVERSQDERAPKEIEIALAVFGRDGASDTATSLDSGVRVYVHRLRKRLGDFYAGKTGPKLEIPKGEYRIILITPAEEAPEEEKPAEASAAPPPAAPTAAGPSLASLFAILLVLISGGFGLWLLWSSVRVEPLGHKLRATAFWQPLGTGPAQLVVGDTFLIAETEDQREIQRMALEPGIRSRENLGSYLQTHPEAFYRLYDLDLNFAPVGTTVAAWEVQNAISRFRANSSGHVPLIPASRLTAGMLDDTDIIYVGRFANLGQVAPLLAQISGVQAGEAYNVLTDRSSGKRFVATIDPGQPGAQVDYGYIASLSAPLGQRIFIIAGIGDTAVRNMAALVGNPEQLRSLEAEAGIHGNYEALFEIKANGDLALSRNSLLTRSIR